MRSHIGTRFSVVLFCSFIALAFVLYYSSIPTYELSTTLPTFNLSIDDTSNYKYCYNSSSRTIIFLHLTSRTDRWNRLEACAFKSAAELNRPIGVCVLSAIEMKPHSALIGLPNLEFAPLDVHKILNGTPLYDWFQNYYSNSKKARNAFALYELSDAMRYAYLYKYGGYYLDTDTITLRNFSAVRNATGFEDVEKTRVANGIMFFDRSHPLLNRVLNEAMNSYKPGIWGTFGPALLTRVVQNAKFANGQFQLLTREFYPITWAEASWSFDQRKTELMQNRSGHAYTLHLYRKAVVDFLSVGNYWADEASLPNGSFANELCGDV